MAYLSVKYGKSETLLNISQRVLVNKILILFATQFDFHGNAIFKHAKNFIVNVYANIYVITTIEDCHPAMVRGA